MKTVSLFRAAALACVLALAACSSSPPPQTGIKVNLVASPQINPNSAHQPSPVVVRVYELKNLDQFSAADFFQLYDTDKQYLAQDLISRREVEVKPGETVTVEAGGPDSAATRFVGVVAAYSDIQVATWRASVPIVQNQVNEPTFNLDVYSLSLAPGPTAHKPSHPWWRLW
jgi:type VI secretion system protein VasD